MNLLGNIFNLSFLPNIFFMSNNTCKSFKVKIKLLIHVIIFTTVELQFDEGQGKILEKCVHHHCM